MRPRLKFKRVSPDRLLEPGIKLGNPGGLAVFGSSPPPFVFQQLLGVLRYTLRAKSVFSVRPSVRGLISHSILSIFDEFPSSFAGEE